MKNFSNKKINILAAILLIIFVGIFSFGDLFETKSASAAWYSSGGTWNYRKQITVDPEKVSGSSNLTDFPMLFKVTDADLKHTAHGGKMGKTDGTDMLFTSSDGSTKLSHEIEYYASTTGEMVAWVKVPTLYTAQETVIYVYFGNSGASNQQDVTNVWDSNYKAVYHFSPGSSFLLDSTSNANNLTNTGVSSTTSQINQGAFFTNASDQYMTIPYASSLAWNASSTIQLWINKTSHPTSGGSYIMELVTIRDFTGWFRLGADGNSANAQKFSYCFFIGSFPCGISSSDLNTGTTYHIAATTDGSNIRNYINGLLDNTTSFTSTPSGSSGDYSVGRLGGGGRNFYGWMDELRISYGATRSADWIATEYNNQSLPTSFYSYGAVGVQNRSAAGVKTKGVAPESSSAIKVRGGVKFR